MRDSRRTKKKKRSFISFLLSLVLLRKNKGLSGPFSSYHSLLQELTPSKKTVTRRFFSLALERNFASGFLSFFVFSSLLFSLSLSLSLSLLLSCWVVHTRIRGKQKNKKARDLPASVSPSFGKQGRASQHGKKLSSTEKSHPASAIDRSTRKRQTAFLNPSDHKPADDRGRDRSAAGDGHAKRRPPRGQVHALADPVDERVRQRRAERGGPDPRRLRHLRPGPGERKDPAGGAGARREPGALGHLHDVEPGRREGEGVPERVEDAVGEHAGEAVPPEAVEGGGGAQAGEVWLLFFAGDDDEK